MSVGLEYPEKEPCRIRRQPGAPTRQGRTPAAASRTRLTFLVLHVAVNVQRLAELGKKYPWPRLARCLSCASSRVWGHGYVPRYFEGFYQPLWVHRLRCPDCGTVYTLRPDLFYWRFRYSVRTILSSLMTKITDGFWLPSLPRQNQQYWYAGFRLQTIRFANLPDTAALDKVLSACFVPVSHSLDCAYLRL